MSAEHFAELVETVQMTKGVTHKKMADVLHIAPSTLSAWKKWGIGDKRKVGPACRRLREFMREAG